MTCPISGCFARTVLSGELLDDAIEIGIAGAKATCEPVPASLRNPLAIREHLELAGLTRRKDRFNA